MPGQEGDFASGSEEVPLPVSLEFFLRYVRSHFWPQPAGESWPHREAVCSAEPGGSALPLVKSDVARFSRPEILTQGDAD